MEFEGVVYKKLPEVAGTSQRGAWKKQDVVFELPSEFSRKICVTFFGDRTEDVADLNEGDTVTVSVNVESREYNGKWYTDVKAWKIVRGSASGASGASGASDASGAGHRSAGHGGAASGSGVGSGVGASGALSSPFNDAPFNESTMPASPADDIDDLPF